MIIFYYQSNVSSSFIRVAVRLMLIKIHCDFKQNMSVQLHAAMLVLAKQQCVGRLGLLTLVGLDLGVVVSVSDFYSSDECQQIIATSQ